MGERKRKTPNKTPNKTPERLVNAGEEAPPDSNATFNMEAVEGLFEDAPPIPEAPSEEIVHIPAQDVLPLPTDDLTQSQKLEFIKIVQKEMSIPERAKRLAALARLKGTKTAAVGLRAIQLMMEVEGWKDEQGQEAPPIFNLPDGVSVSVKVEPSRK